MPLMSMPLASLGKQGLPRTTEFPGKLQKGVVQGGAWVAGSACLESPGAE